ncbi:hypothetical protein B0H10DRAFT_676465 [Mycena sp. CBHHK59/15]|nr:hypothetical protein B0H10DRAFT_676465 [Mycena sp. CBHHK59/15]
MRVKLQHISTEKVLRPRDPTARLGHRRPERGVRVRPARLRGRHERLVARRQTRPRVEHPPAHTAHDVPAAPRAHGVLPLLARGQASGAALRAAGGDVQ